MQQYSSESDGFPSKSVNTFTEIRYRFIHNNKIYYGKGMWKPGEFYGISHDNQFIEVEFQSNNPNVNRLVKSEEGLRFLVR